MVIILCKTCKRGAAGGLGFAFRTFLKGELESGISIVLRETKLEEHMQILLLQAKEDLTLRLLWEKHRQALLRLRRSIIF